VTFTRKNIEKILKNNPSLKIKDKPATRSKPKPKISTDLSSAERAYEERLQAQLLSREIRSWRRCRLKLVLAFPRQGLPGMTYLPDYEVIALDGQIELHEVKGGYTREDSRIKLKSAVDLFPAFTFVLAQQERGEWSAKRFK
jgi:hypothetical protein